MLIIVNCLQNARRPHYAGRPGRAFPIEDLWVAHTGGWGFRSISALSPPADGPTLQPVRRPSVVVRIGRCDEVRILLVRGRDVFARGQGVRPDGRPRVGSRG